MIKVKLTFPFPDWPILRQTPASSGIWGDCQFFVNQDIEECDYWVVFDGLLKPEKTLCPSENTIFITAEPPTIKTYSQKFLNQFATVVTCQREIKHSNIIYSQQGHPWFVGKTYDQLKSNLSIEKTKLLSIITSNKLFTKGHRKRYEFAMKLKDHFGELVDLYGRGIRDFEDKWEVLAPYKYSIAIENLAYDDWLTEKLPDCFLAETFPFYYGCPNVEKYFNHNSFIRINLDNFRESIEVIEKTIVNSDHYLSNRINLINSKNQYMDKYNFFPLITHLLYSIELNENMKIPIIINPEDKLANNFINKVKRKIKSFSNYFFENNST